MKRATRAAQQNYHGVNISIHALVKRATTYIEHTTHEDGISIHALVKRATLSGRYVRHTYRISIHALVKRATTFRAIIAVRYSDFNPRPREEGDFFLSSSV